MKRNKSELNRLIKEGKQDMRIAGVPYDQHCPIILSDYRMLKVLGQCIENYDGNEYYAECIKINRLFFESGEEQEIKNTICHELIHSFHMCIDTNCGHRGLWKIYAEQMEENYPDKYVIRRLTKTSEQYTEALKARVTERRDSIKKKERRM